MIEYSGGFAAWASRAFPLYTTRRDPGTGLWTLPKVPGPFALSLALKFVQLQPCLSHEFIPDFLLQYKQQYFTTHQDAVPLAYIITLLSALLQSPVSGIISLELPKMW